jgi:mono/diheme cytochrome c family protein
MKIKVRLCLSVATVMIVAVCAAGLFIYPIHWRAKIIVEKVAGQLPAVGWSDLAWMLRPNPTVFLADMGDPPNPYSAIKNPLDSPSDIAAGKRIFEQHCTHCHGNEADGGAGGPSLHERVFRQGRSDWALYRTITRGIPGTAMIGWKFGRDDVWRLVAYLNDILLAGRALPLSAGTSGPLVEPVSADALIRAESDASEWLTYSGSYSGQRHSQLSFVDTDNVR